MKGLLLFFVLIISQISFSQSNQWVNFDISNSKLPNNSVYAIAIDQQGLKWIGTDGGGLTKFDGTRWTTYNSSNSPMKSDFVRCIYVDQQNVKWVGTKYGGVQKFDGTNWTIYNKQNTLMPDDWVTCIAVDSKGVKWFGLGAAGLVRFDDTTWTVYTAENSGLPVNAVYSLAIDSKDVKWVGTNGGGMARFDDKTWTVYNKKNSGIHCNATLQILIDKANNKWIGTYTCGVVEYTESDWYIFNKEDHGLNDNWVRALTMDAKETKWVGLDSAGFAYLDGKMWVNFDSTNSPLADKHIMALAVDKQDNKWVGTYLKGITVYNQNGVVLPATISVLYPNSTTNWVKGSMQTVTWSSSEVKSNVNIKLSTDGGSTFPIVLASNTANDGTALINVPNLLSDKCRVKVESATDATLLGLSSGNFRIVKISAPLQVFPSNGQAGLPVSPTLKWRKAEFAERYRLQISPANTFATFAINDSTITDTSRTVTTSILQGKKYFWRVCGRNSTGDGNLSAVWSFTTQLTAPNNLTAAMPDKKKIRLTWKDNSDNETGFIIERKFIEGFTVLDTVKANTTMFIDSLFKVQGTYQYRIRAYSSDALSEYSSPAQLTTTGVNDASMPGEFTLYQNYPNPFNPSTTIKYVLPGQSDVGLVIYNIKGEAVRTFIISSQHAGGQQIIWDGKDSFGRQAASGTYIVRLKVTALDGKVYDKSAKMILLK